MRTPMLVGTSKEVANSFLRVMLMVCVFSSWPDSIATPGPGIRQGKIIIFCSPSCGIIDHTHALLPSMPEIWPVAVTMSRYPFYINPIPSAIAIMNSIIATMICISLRVIFFSSLLPSSAPAMAASVAAMISGRCSWSSASLKRVA